jgi:hypothetical protein
VIRRRPRRMASVRAVNVHTLAFRRHALTFDPSCSMGFGAGLHGGRNHTQEMNRVRGVVERAPVGTAVDVWVGRMPIVRPSISVKIAWPLESLVGVERQTEFLAFGEPVRVLRTGEIASQASFARAPWSSLGALRPGGRSAPTND